MLDKLTLIKVFRILILFNVFPFLILIIKARLEMNKEGLAKDLVCLLDLANDVQQAKLKEKIENFFIAASTRIDAIAKIMDLDNDIGTFNFDIENLAETENQLRSLGEAPGKH